MTSQVFRSKTAYALGWVWLVFAAFNAVDLIVRFNGTPSVVAAMVLGVLTVIVFLTCLRPVIHAREDGILVRNPLRNAVIPWSAVDEVRVAHAIVIASGEHTVRCWAPQSSARERVKAERRVAAASRPGRRRGTEMAVSKAEQAALEAMAGRTHADWVAQQLTETAESRSRDAAEKGGARVTWSPSALGAVAAALVMVAVAFLAG